MPVASSPSRPHVPVKPAIVDRERSCCAPRPQGEVKERGWIAACSYPGSPALGRCGELHRLSCHTRPSNFLQACIISGNTESMRRIAECCLKSSQLRGAHWLRSAGGTGAERFYRFHLQLVTTRLKTVFEVCRRKECNARLSRKPLYGRFAGARVMKSLFLSSRRAQRYVPLLLLRTANPAVVRNF